MAKPSLRDDLIGAGLWEFRSRGYAATGIQAITDRAGAPRGSFYWHFPSKEAFAVAVVAAYVAYHEPTRGPEPACAADRIRTEFRGYARRLEQTRLELGCLLGIFGAETESLGGDVREAVATGVREWAERLAGELSIAYREAGSAAPEDLLEQAEELIGAWEAAIWRARLLRDPAPLHRFLRRTLEAAIPRHE